MQGWRDNISNIIYNKKFLLVIGVAALFTAAALYVYNFYVAPRLNPTYVTNREWVTADDSTNMAEVYYFYTDWCPYCKKAQPIWEKIKNQYSEKTLNGKILYFKEVNCEKEEKIADQFNIEGYPTIKLVKGNEIIDYDAKPDEKSLTEFLTTSV